MPFFNGTPPERSAQRLPAEKRISLPASQRLTTITEGPGALPHTPPPIPRRSSRRNSLSSPLGYSRRWSGSSTDETTKSAPPPYEWVTNPRESRGDESSQGKHEKLAWLRRGDGQSEKKRRGGWLRLALIIGVVLLVIVGLAVGLGVGLSRKKTPSISGGEQRQDQQQQQQQQQPSTSTAPSTAPSTSPATSSPARKPPQKFPLGEYSMVTALMNLEAGCTANAATWRCWPFAVFSPSTNASSMATFNWIISNTSSSYATSSSTSTPDGGMPANLTVSTSGNPFDVTFTNKPLTYISSSSDSSSARLIFSFTMAKQVDPLIALTQDGVTTTCFYNQTTYSGTLYLSTPRTYPPDNLADSTSLGGYEQWPYAVEITQTADGGTDVPSCYKTVDGQVGERITSSLNPQASTSECLCDYRNF